MVAAVQLAGAHSGKEPASLGQVHVWVGHDVAEALHQHRVREHGQVAEGPLVEAVVELLEDKGVQYTTWDGWLVLDEYEQSLGQSSHDAEGNPRERVKVVERDEMISVSREGVAK